MALRQYLHRSALRVTGDAGDVHTFDPVRRLDRRFTLSLAAVLHPSPRLDLTFSGEYVAVDSNVKRAGAPMSCQPGEPCHALDYGDATAHRTSFGMDAAWRW